MFELDLKKGEYITQRQKKNFKYAIQWCLENNWDSCRVNKTYYNFDFDKMQVNIVGIGYGNNNTYNIKKVNTIKSSSLYIL